MRHDAKFCQTKSLIILLLFVMGLFFSSCATDEMDAKVVTAIPVWNQSPSRFFFKGHDGELDAHPFFDLVPFSSTIDNSLNVFITTPVGSKALYDFDLYSGKTYKKLYNCKQKDAWGSYSGKLTTPNFSIGFVPRLLDQIGRPQQVYVFGREKHYSQIKHGQAVSSRVRIVGGTLEQYCKEYPCSENNQWVSRIVLIAVDTSDLDMVDVRTITDLKKKVDWKYAHAYMQNMRGRNVVSTVEYPAYRTIGEIKPELALKTALSKGHMFNFEEMKSLKRTCHKLYDYVWKGAEKVRRNDKRRVSEFASFFSTFYEKYGKQFTVCSSMIRHASLSDNPDRFWFFALLDGFFKMEKTGYVYSCRISNWILNPDNPETGTPIYDNSKMYKQCNDKSLDRAFVTMFPILVGSSRTNGTHVRYVEYDNQPYGSHQKLYSWVLETGKRNACIDKKLMKSGMELFSVFPKDVNWKPFHKKRKKKISPLIN